MTRQTRCASFQLDVLITSQDSEQPVLIRAVKLKVTELKKKLQMQIHKSCKNLSGGAGLDDGAADTVCFC